MQLAAARASGNARRYSLVAGIQAALLASFCLALVVGLRKGLPGYVVGVLSAAVGAAAAGAFLSGHPPAWPSRWKSLLKPALQFGLPLVLVNVSGWAIAALDRFLVNAYLGLDATGTYGLAYRLGSLANPLLIVPFAAMFPPVLFARMARSGQGAATRLLRQAHLGMVVVSVTIAGGITLGTPILLRIFGGGAYLTAGPTLRWIAWGFVGYASYYVSTNVFALLRLTGWTAIVTFIALALNVVGNVLLIPRYGIEGAGMTSCISNLALAALTVLLARWVTRRAALRAAAG